MFTNGYSSVFCIKQSMKAQEKPIKKRRPLVTFASLGQSVMKMQRMFGTVILHISSVINVLLFKGVIAQRLTM